MDSSVSSVSAAATASSSAFAGNASAQKKAAGAAATTVTKPVSTVVNISVRGEQRMRAGATTAPVASTQTSAATTNGPDLQYGAADGNRDGAVSGQEQFTYDSSHAEKAAQAYTAVQQLATKPL